MGKDLLFSLRTQKRTSSLFFVLKTCRDRCNVQAEPCTLLNVTLQYLKPAWRNWMSFMPFYPQRLNKKLHSLVFQELFDFWVHWIFKKQNFPSFLRKKREPKNSPKPKTVKDNRKFPLWEHQIAKNLSSKDDDVDCWTKQPIKQTFTEQVFHWEKLFHVGQPQIS